MLLGDNGGELWSSSVCRVQLVRWVAKAKSWQRPSSHGSEPQCEAQPARHWPRELVVQPLLCVPRASKSSRDRDIQSKQLDRVWVWVWRDLAGHSATGQAQKLPKAQNSLHARCGYDARAGDLLV